MRRSAIYLMAGIITLGIIFEFGYKLAFIKQNTPEYLQGQWNGHLKVTVRLREKGKYIFIQAPDSILIHFSIDKEGKIEGTYGGATFINSHVKRNRGAIFRFLHMATDFEIEGELQGKIFETDPSVVKTICVPFNFSENSLEGSFFQRQGFGLFPMSDFTVKKIK